MKRIGLALSGGGFRATLYHLGLTRFLRDADLLSKVTHITSVSGGNIYALSVSTHYPSDVTADGGGPVYYQQQVLATVPRSDFGTGF